MFYISAATDLEREREILGRMVADVPVDLGWRIVQSPLRDLPVDREAVVRADIHLLLLGGDIRAPVGTEWMVARQAGRWPTLWLKQPALRTPAAQDFIRFVGGEAAWHPFRDPHDLRTQALRQVSEHIMARAGQYALTAAELAALQSWRETLDRPAENAAGAAAGAVAGTGRGETGESAIVLSRERYMPSEGVLLRSQGES